MTELENEVTSIDEIEDTEIGDNQTVLTEDDYYRVKESLWKAETKWVKPTKQLMQKLWVKTFEELETKLQVNNKLESNDNISSKEEIKKILIEEKFYMANPDAEAYREKIENFTKKGLSLEDGYLLASKKDREIEETREVYWKSMISWEQWSDVVSAISIDAFDRMTAQQQDDYNKKMTSKYWKVRFK